MITYDPELHRYAIDGQPVPSITQIINAAGLSPFSGSNRTDVLENAAQRGTFVHDACQMYDEGDLDWDALDPVLVPYVVAWQSFREESGFVPKIIERMVFDPIRRFAGRLDRTGIMGASFSKCIIDIKTGEVYADAGIQLAAYQSCLLEEWRTAKRIAVKLSDDGSYRIHEFKSRDDLKLFNAACSLWHWRKKEGLI